MSKSLDNSIGITEPPNEMFGKLMSISDVLMWRYFELLSFKPLEEIAKLRKECAEGRNPRDAKVMLAQEIVARFHTRRAADAALAEFESRFRDGAMPESMPEVILHAAGRGIGDPPAHQASGAHLQHIGSDKADRAARTQDRRRHRHRQGTRRRRRQHGRGSGRKAEVRASDRPLANLRPRPAW